MDDLLTTKQLQELLQVDRITIYRMLNDGRLRGFKVGGQWRFSHREIETWLQEQQGRPNETEPSPAQSANLSPSSEALHLSCVQAIQGVCADALDIGNVGAFEEPRELITAVATDYRELKPSRELNWCCGGGGGLIADTDMFETRMRGGLPKVEQIRASGAEWVVTACENCKTQLEDLNEHYELEVEIKGIWDLIADALIL